MSRVDVAISEPLFAALAQSHVLTHPAMLAACARRLSPARAVVDATNMMAELVDRQPQVVNDVATVPHIVGYLATAAES